MESPIEWRDDRSFSIDGQGFACGFGRSNSERFMICKSRSQVEFTLDLLDRLQPQRIIEIGIYEGGSIALSTLAVRPALVVGIDCRETRVEPLDSFIRQRRLGDRVDLHYSTDQADRTRVLQIVGTAMSSEPIDLIIDDASHWIDETRASFETMFPLLRPGGLFVIEDWNWQLRGLHAFRSRFEDSRSPSPGKGFESSVPSPGTTLVHKWFENEHRRPLEHLAAQLLLIQACDSGVINSLRFDRFGITVERGPRELDPLSFHVADEYSDYPDHRRVLFDQGD